MCEKHFTVGSVSAVQKSSIDAVQKSSIDAVQKSSIDTVKQWIEFGLSFLL